MLRGGEWKKESCERGMNGDTGRQTEGGEKPGAPDCGGLQKGVIAGVVHSCLSLSLSSQRLCSL